MDELIKALRHMDAPDMAYGYEGEYKWQTEKIARDAAATLIALRDKVTSLENDLAGLSELKTQMDADHQPMFVKWDAVQTFDKWNDTTGAIPNGTSWYHECCAVVEEVAAMAFGAGIFYEAERHSKSTPPDEISIDDSLTQNMPEDMRERFRESYSGQRYI